MKRLTPVLVVLVGLAAPTGAQAVSAVSSNWAGYVARPAAGRKLRSVSSTWVEPAVTCTAGHSSYSAIWVGLGGYSENAAGLEQIGTDADCNRSGQAIYSTWVELLPNAPTALSVKARPGERITASVTVIGRDATLGLRNLTSGERTRRTVRVSALDTSSAEWIVEAPSECFAENHCRALPLADFGTVAFTSATATLGARTATIDSGAWSTTSLELQGTRAIFAGSFAQGVPPALALVVATPSASSAADGAFTVAYSERRREIQPREAPTLPGFTGGPPA